MPSGVVVHEGLVVSCAHHGHDTLVHVVSPNSKPFLRESTAIIGGQSRPHVVIHTKDENATLPFHTPHANFFAQQAVRTQIGNDGFWRDPVGE
jgi:hypothetical protein